MERKRKVLPLLKGVKIERYAAEGKSVAHLDSIGANVEAKTWLKWNLLAFSTQTIHLLK